MGKEIVLASYSEIALKSRPVRRLFERLLCRHIRCMLKLDGFSKAKVRRIQGRLIVENINPEKAAETVARVFGVASAMPAVMVTGDLATILETAITIAERIIEPNQTFAIDVRRVSKQDYSRREMEACLGEAVLKSLEERNVHVDLDDPNRIIHVEVRDEFAYLYHQVVPGLRGLPFNSQGKLIGLLSGGIDSPVAVWLMMRRGAYVMPLFLDQRPLIGEDYYRRGIKVARQIRRYVPLQDFYLHVAPMGEIMEKIVEQIPARLRCIACKRMMYRVACRFGEKEEAGGIVTGESLGQVASQTMANLKVLTEASNLPIYRPLIGMTKDEIVKWARKISTYESSTTPVQECNVVSSRPVTKAKMEIVATTEKRLDIEGLVSKALKDVVSVKL